MGCWLVAGVDSTWNAQLLDRPVPSDLCDDQVFL